ncbi:hypothetical protein [Gynuella sunshinyii]|uniref:7-carboxy-7-deazaguanine synthase n=2 Tax=Gynuella sunshinyii TaxID=1445505 RepID=A0A0C5V0I1_9GAMM|nr:hypothetical protein [Gynuella sunshinyii]AII80607.1 radical SAM domain-containing protein [Gynuella sunshinyii YC6258]AJQ93075.1 organic radical activating enzyme [Gynuella sunshinyii YC6258]
MKYQWSEIFLSIEGEAKWSGHPTVYIRFTRCNFSCKGFNNPDNIEPASERALGFSPQHINTISEIPEISIGCDSIYSWHKDFRHLWHQGDEHVLAAEVTKVLPSYGWKSNTGQEVILSLTGGEPTLHAKTIPHLLSTPEFNQVKHVLIETNCSVPLSETFITALDDWALNRKGRITWSNSPKLKASGEPFDKAIRPEIALMQRRVTQDRCIQYFKFVCRNDDDFQEVQYVMEQYYRAGIPRNVEVYIMPMACTEQQQKKVMQDVAMKCLEYGFIYCHRIQNTVFENAIGK